MKITPLVPPREFAVGQTGSITIRHCADVALQQDEQVTFVTESGSAHDVVRKSWGYYATGSLNGRLREHGLRAALACNGAGKLYVLLVERGKEAEFDSYLRNEQQQLLTWLDRDADAERVAKLLAGPTS